MTGYIVANRTAILPGFNVAKIEIVKQYEGHEFAFDIAMMDECSGRIWLCFVIPKIVDLKVDVVLSARYARRCQYVTTDFAEIARALNLDPPSVRTKLDGNPEIVVFTGAAHPDWPVQISSSRVQLVVVERYRGIASNDVSMDIVRLDGDLPLAEGPSQYAATPLPAASSSTLQVAGELELPPYAELYWAGEVHECAVSIANGRTFLRVRTTSCQFGTGENFLVSVVSPIRVIIRRAQV
ncbi:MAG: hypothetical protein S0880_17775 [Actinomycetota bacterium]|nr:hypothetical protein [Actinomycetota bacterium]